MTFSIITVNYNNADGLQRTIDSVVNQDYNDYEWIVIDGGSTDGSREIVEHNQQYFSFWCSEPDNGIYNAMNKGISHANGDYLLFLNSGDILYDDSVLKSVAVLKLDVDLIIGQAERMDNHFPLRTINNNMLLQLYKDTLNHQATFIKRCLFKNNKYDESLKIVSDWKFWLQSVIYGNASYMVIDRIIVIQDMTGVSNSYENHLQESERKQVLNVYFPTLLQQELDDRYRNETCYRRIAYLESQCRFLYFVCKKIIALLYRIARH